MAIIDPLMIQIQTVLNKTGLNDLTRELSGLQSRLNTITSKGVKEIFSTIQQRGAERKNLLEQIKDNEAMQGALTSVGLVLRKNRGLWLEDLRTGKAATKDRISQIVKMSGKLESARKSFLEFKSPEITERGTEIVPLKKVQMLAKGVKQIGEHAFQTARKGEDLSILTEKIDEGKNVALDFDKEVTRGLINRFLKFKGVNAVLDETGNNFRTIRGNAIIAKDQIDKIRKLLRSKQFAAFKLFADDTKTFKGEFLSLGFTFTMAGQKAANAFKSLVAGYNAAFEKASPYQRTVGQLTASFSFLKFQIIDAFASSEFIQRTVEVLSKMIDVISDNTPREVLAGIATSLLLIAGIGSVAGTAFMFLVGADSFFAFIRFLSTFAGLSKLATIGSTLKDISLLTLSRGSVVLGLAALALALTPAVIERVSEILSKFLGLEETGKQTVTDFAKENDKVAESMKKVEEATMNAKVAKEELDRSTSTDTIIKDIKAREDVRNALREQWKAEDVLAKAQSDAELAAIPPVRGVGGNLKDAFANIWKNIKAATATGLTAGIVTKNVQTGVTAGIVSLFGFTLADLFANMVADDRRYKEIKNMTTGWVDDANQIQSNITKVQSKTVPVNVQAGPRAVTVPNLQTIRTPIEQTGTVAEMNSVFNAISPIVAIFPTLLNHFATFKKDILENQAYPKLLGTINGLFGTFNTTIMAVDAAVMAFTSHLIAEAAAHQSVANAVNAEASAFDRLIQSRKRAGAGPSTVVTTRQGITAGGNTGGGGSVL